MEANLKLFVAETGGEVGFTDGHDEVEAVVGPARPEATSTLTPSLDKVHPELSERDEASGELDTGISCHQTADLLVVLNRKREPMLMAVYRMTSTFYYLSAEQFWISLNY